MIKNLYVLPLFLNLVSFNTAFAIDYYWVGGSGNWSDFANHWATTSGGNTFHIQVPQSVDRVYFDANSFSAPNQTVTIDQTIVSCGDMLWTGAMHNPTLAGPNSSNLRIYGTLTLIPAITFSFAGPIFFEATSTGHQITMAGKTFNSNVTFNGIGGEWTLQDAFTTNSNSTIALNNGSLITNNQAVTANVFQSNSGNTRSLTMGSSVFNLSNITTFWNVNATGLTLNAGTSTINSTNNSAGWSPTFNGGNNLVYYDVNFQGTLTQTGTLSGNNTFHDVFFASAGTISNNNTFNKVTISKNGTINGDNTYSYLKFSPGYTYTLTISKTQTILTTLDAIGNCGALITIVSNTQGTQSTLSKASGTVNTDFLVLKDIKAQGGATFNAPNSIDLGNNTGWNITSPTTKDLYWIGNSGNWDDGSHWATSSGGSPSGCSPTPVDNVFFDANSFSAGGQTVTINVPTAYCNNMTWTGAGFNPAFAGVVGNNLKIYGSLTFISGMTLSFAGPVSFEATGPGKTITSAGKIFNNNVTFNGIGGEWTLQDAFSTNSNSSIILNHGSLITNDQIVTANVFQSNSGNTRSLTMGSSVFNLSNITTFWNVNATGFTLDAGTSTINSTNNSAGWSPTFNGGNNLVYYDVNFLGTLTQTGTLSGNNTFHDVFFASAGTISANNTFNNVVISKNGTITGNNTYNSLTFSTGYTYTLTSGKVQTIISSLNAQGNCGGLIAINSSISGSQSDIVKVTDSVVVKYVNLKDIKASGGAVFVANSSVDLGNSTGWVINVAAPQDLYWIGDSGNWDDGSHWATSSGGSPSGCSPTPVDNVFFDANSFSSGSQTVTVNVPTAYCNNMTWTGSTNHPTFAGVAGNNLKIYGSLTLISDMTLSFAGPVFFEAVTTGKTITSAGKMFNSNVTFNGIGGEWTLLDPFATNSNSSIILNNGSLITNNQTVTANVFQSNSGNTRSLTMGSSVFNLSNITTFWNVNATGMTLNAGTSTINSTNNSAGWSPTFNGGHLVYYDLNFLGDLTQTGSIQGNNTFHDVSFKSHGTISGNNTFHDVTIAKNGTIMGDNTYHDLNFTPGFTYTLAIGKTQTILHDLNISGTGGFPVRIQSTVVGTPSSFHKDSGLVCVDYVRISDNTATGAAVPFSAGANSQDLGGNTGWDFNGGGSAVTPQVSISASPSGTVCAGTNVQFTATPTYGGTAPAFHWKVNGVSVQNGNSAQFSSDSLNDNDVVTCEMTSNAPCASPSIVAASDTVSVTTDAGTVTLDAPVTNMCSGDSLIVCAPSGFATYAWNSGENTACIYAKAAGNYYITATDNNGCTAESNRVGISVYPIPSVSISVQGDTLIAYNGISYQWYYNNQIISGATSPILVATQSGNYQVEITDANGCRSRSVATTITVGIADLSADTVRIYPNPSPDGVWRIETHAALRDSKLEVFDAAGRKVFETLLLQEKILLQLNTATGIYTGRITTPSDAVIFKLLKQ